MSFVPLHVHSQYSILESTLSLKQIVDTAKKFEIGAIALTDNGNMFGAVEFYKACKSAKIKPIIGCEIEVASGSRFHKKKSSNTPPSFPIILLVKDEKGYKNLCKLASLAYVEGFYYRPRIDKELLGQYREGLICLYRPRIESDVEWFKEIFKEDLYFELQRHAMSEEAITQDKIKESWLLQKFSSFVENEKKINFSILKLSEKFGIKSVATNSIHYLEREDWKAHEILLNVQSGEPCEIWSSNSNERIPNPKRKTFSSHEFYFKSPKQMEDLFSDIPSAISTSIEIGEKCNFSFDFKKKHYPVFIPTHLEGKEISSEERKKEAEKFLYTLCTSAIEKRYGKEDLVKIATKYPNKDPLKIIRDRVDYEFNLFSSKEMCDYILVVHDFVSWAKKNSIPIGPGRGSAAGSIICYLIGITDIEPLKFDLFFERFINPERISYPDIDVDICMERRQEVINYTIEKYGKERVAQIITFGTMKAKMAVRDVGRVLSVPLTKVNAIAKLVPEELNITLEKALETDQELKQIYESDEEVKRVIDMAKKLEGSIRNTGIHAAGIIISATDLQDNIPICTAKDTDMIVTQYSMKPIEIVGMLKIDFLGLKTLTSLLKASKLVEKTRGEKIDWTRLPLDNKETFELLNHGKTLGVFQLETGGMQDLSKNLHIDCFEEIIAVGALYRPGPMEMIPSFINRKHGKETIELDHPLMAEILKETYGVMVYQEQVMQIASKLAGYSLAEGDVLRRVMGKKEKAEMKKQKEKFIQGALKNNIPEETAITIFDKIEKFASYGFNKSHATAYAYLTYATAYFKTLYPAEWMAALMTSDVDDLTKLTKFVYECRSMNIAVLPPDINESYAEFMVVKNQIRFAMAAIKGVGMASVEAIVKEREKGGSFKTLYDFISRIDLNRVSRKNIELLIEAGAFDFSKWSRDALLQSLDKMISKALHQKEEEEKGVLSLLSLIGTNSAEEFSMPPQVEKKSTPLQILQKEKELLGFYLTSHPMDNYKETLQKLSCVQLHEITREDSFCKMAFTVEEIETKFSSKTQKKFAILTVNDGENRFELPIWPELYEKSTNLLSENQLLYSIVQVDKKEEIKLQCRFIADLTKIDTAAIKEFENIYNQLKNQSSPQRKKASPFSLVTIIIDADKITLSNIVHMKELFKENGGNAGIKLKFLSAGQNIGRINAGNRHKINYQEQLQKKLKEIKGVVAIEET